MTHRAGCITRVYKRGGAQLSIYMFRVLRISSLNSAFIVFGFIWGFHTNYKLERITEYKSRKDYLEFVFESQTK